MTMANSTQHSLPWVMDGALAGASDDLKYWMGCLISAVKKLSPEAQAEADCVWHTLNAASDKLKAQSSANKLRIETCRKQLLTVAARWHAQQAADEAQPKAPQRRDSGVGRRTPGHPAGKVRFSDPVRPMRAPRPEEPMRSTRQRS